jgi:DNA polymerase III epsilon subunit-like protein
VTWYDERLIAFDVETTGVDREESRIVTAAVSYVGGGEDTYSIDWLVNPGVSIPTEASDIHGITDSKVEAYGVDAHLAIGEIIEALVKTPGTFVAYNASFDFTILDREARRYGFTPLQGALEDRGRSLRIVDPFILDRYLHKFVRGKGQRKLEPTCGRYGISLDNAHDAFADALAAARLAWVMGKKATIQDDWERQYRTKEWESVRHDIDKLHEFQVRIAAEQCNDLAQYKRSKGKPFDGRPEWPIVPVTVAA